MENSNVAICTLFWCVLARYNTLLARYVMLFARYDTLFARYDTLLVRYDTPLARYASCTLRYASYTLLTHLHASNTFWSHFEITWKWLKPEINKELGKAIIMGIYDTEWNCRHFSTLHLWNWKSVGCNIYIKKKYRFSFKQCWQIHERWNM
jgi:branched-subunit amino acid transport protein